MSNSSDDRKEKDELFLTVYGETNMDDDEVAYNRIMFDISYDMLKLARADVQKRTLNSDRHIKENEIERMSALVWIFVPGEGAHEATTFDECCKRIGIDPDNARMWYSKLLRPNELDIYSKYRPDILI